MKKKIIPVVVALLLILLIGGATVGKKVIEKYSYSKETVDMNEFYQVSGEQSAIILQDEMVAEKAIIRNGLCYLDLDTVHEYLNEIFYVDLGENLLLYTTANETIRVNLGESIYTTAGGAVDAGYPIAYAENDVVYVAADFVKQYTNFSYDMYDRHVQVYTQWGDKEVADIRKDTAVREKGGVKSPILREIAEGETVEILEEMETWSKVKTSDSVIGYVENKRLTGKSIVEETPVTDYAAPEYTALAMDGKVNLGWHAIGAAAGNSTLGSAVANSKGMNVIAPTWFSLNDNEGNFRSFATDEYVIRAHEMGLQVWGVLDDFNYNNETGGGIDVYAILSSTSKRQKLAQNITTTALELGLDGINLDFERVSDEAGIHYVQFLRELSVLCRENGIVLSVDNYVPLNSSNYYRLDIQGLVADYVIIMGYDEHWGGCPEAGSVASIDYVSGGLDRTLEQVPAEKVINAVPFYTRLWVTKGAEVTSTAIPISNVEECLNRYGKSPEQAEWDETICQNYIEWEEGETLYQMWIEDMESLNVKLNVMRNKNIAGVAVWRLGYGTSEVWELLNAYSGS